MSLNQLFSYNNLELAWRRINTASNLQYKRFFRELNYAYEIAASANLKDLQTHLKGGSFGAKPSTRIYIPKSSGLQRPITLISLEDQIVWQAVANFFAKKMREKRAKVEMRCVYSNILQKPSDNIFFVKNWKYTYGKFLDRIEDYYNKGYRWIAHFDLAAFYDTICHELLMETLFPRQGGVRFREYVNDWLRTWSSDKSLHRRAHGIPQGPVASDFVAECFLYSIDKIMYGSRKFKYVRYVDDIRLLAKNGTDLHKASVQLEVLCRNKGLIPQAKKYYLKEANSLEEVLGSLPSIRVADDETFNRKITLTKSIAIKKLREAFSRRKPHRIVDKTRARYVFFNAEPCRELTRYATKFLLIHPEHIDAFVHYFNYCKASKTIIRACKQKLQKTPYEYVQGELWHILARMMKPQEMRTLIDRAVNTAKNKHAGIAAKWGALHFLCKAEANGLGNYSKFLMYQDNAFLQALLVPVLPESSYDKIEVLRRLLKRRSFEPGIMLAEQFIERDLKHTNFNLTVKQLPDQVANVYRVLKIVKGPKKPIDPMNEILARRYKLKQQISWRKLFKKKYGHNLQILKLGDAVFKSGRSTWLIYQNSFNHGLFIAFQDFLNTNKLPGALKIVGKDRKLVNYGSLLDKNKAFAKTYPLIAKNLKLCNDRRNNLPGAHPYDSSGKNTRYLNHQEQNGVFKKLKTVYSEIIKQIDNENK